MNNNKRSNFTSTYYNKKENREQNNIPIKKTCQKDITHQKRSKIYSYYFKTSEKIMTRNMKEQYKSKLIENLRYGTQEIIKDERKNSEMKTK